MFRDFEVNTIVIFELESEFEFQTNGGTVVGMVIECKEGFVRVSFPRINTLSQVVHHLHLCQGSSPALPYWTQLGVSLRH